MDELERTNVRLAVDDERLLYTPFSPENELSDSLKRYIRTKLSSGKSNTGYSLTVVAKHPIDEEKFLSAMSNWNKEERAFLKVNEKNTIRMLFGLLIFGSLMFILSLYLIKHNTVLQYSLLPIIGSLSLSKATGILVIEMPTIRAKKWILNEMEHNSVITFEYENEKVS